MITDYRNIPVEVLRDFARTQSEVTSIRLASAEAGIGRSTYHKFIQGITHPQPRVRRRLGLWYIAKQGEPADIDVVRPYVAALDILLSDLPAHERAGASAQMAEWMGMLYAERAESIPRWLELLLKS